MAANFEETAMETIVVAKSQLLEALKKNLTTHKNEYDEAMVGYRTKRNDAIRNVGDVASSCDLLDRDSRTRVHKAWDDYKKITTDEPINRSGSYEQAIMLMEWERRDEFEISINDFECYVRDNWRWKTEQRRKYLSNSGRR